MSSLKKPLLSNKLQLTGTVWLASDIHLGPDTPKTWAQFSAFLQRAGNEADALIIGGDLFDAWIGDDVALNDPSEWLGNVLNQLADTGKKTQLYIARGNRDFLIGRQLCNRIHATLLPEPAFIHTDFGPILFTHGDELCTDDKSYQRFRSVVRNHTVQKLFFLLSMPLRERIARMARQRSMQANKTKRAEIMDVNAVAVKDMFMNYDIKTLVHGHTHRPAVRVFDLGQSGVLRHVVLPDWDYDHSESPRGGWLHITADTLKLVSTTNHDFPIFERP